MAKAKEARKKERLAEWNGRYQLLVKKVDALSRIAVRQFAGMVRPDEDPRIDYLVRQHSTVAMLSAQVAMLIRVVTQGGLSLPDDGKGAVRAEREVFLTRLYEELENVVKQMEGELCITAWTDDLEPLFDLPRWREKTQNWPA